MPRYEWASGNDCNKIVENTLSEKEYDASANRKEKAAHLMQSSRTLQSMGVNKDVDFFRDIFETATKKDLKLHEMTEADYKKFKWELADREMWFEQGFDGGGSAFKVLEANLKRIPGGRELYDNVARISAYHREHTRVNNNRIATITDSVGKLAKELGIDINKLSELELKIQGARNTKEQNEAVNEIQNYLGALNSESSRTTAGDLYLSIRDVMENTPVDQLRRRDSEGNLVPWNSKQQEAFKVIQDNWFSMRKDLVRVLKNALRTEKRIISQTDRNEGGRRRLTEYLERIENYINTLEFQENSNSGRKGRKYDIDGREVHEFGLNGKKEWDLNTSLGYMPHYVLTIVKDLQKFNDFAMNTTESRSAFEVFESQVRLWEGAGGVLNRVKSRADINQEYYSRNPFLFLSKYMHEVSSYNHANSMKEAMQATMNMFIEAKRNGKELGDKDMVNRFVDQASEVINHIVENSIGTSTKEHSMMDKAGRFMTGMAFIRTMGFNGRSALRNSGQQLLERIRMGFFRRGQAEEYLVDTELKNTMNYEATKHGILWTKDGKFLTKLQKVYQMGGQEGTKGTIEDRPLLPGLREVTDKNGKKSIEMYDESMSDKLMTVVESVAQKGSVLHTMVENMNRFGTFKVGYATAHENLSKQPVWYIEGEMRQTNTTPEQRSQWIAQTSGKIAYSMVSDVHFEYGKIFKPQVFQEGGGAVLGQFQHYRFSLMNLQHDIWKRGWRDIMSGDYAWSNDGAGQLYRLGTAYAMVSALTNITGIGFSNLLSNDNVEWLKSHIAYYTAEKDSEGKLTEDGLKQAQQATYGKGSWSDFGPTVSTLIELGEIMHWWSVDMDSYLPMLESSERNRDLDDDDLSYKLTRLANIQLARLTHHTVPAFFNRNWTKVFYTETGLYTDYETTKNSIQFWDWARSVTGIPGTGGNQGRLTRKRRMPSPNTGGGIQRGIDRSGGSKY